MQPVAQLFDLLVPVPREVESAGAVEGRELHHSVGRDSDVTSIHDRLCPSRDDNPSAASA